MDEHRAPDDIDANDWKTGHEALTGEIIHRAMLVFGGEDGFDTMEIVRALAAVAFRRLDMVEDKDVAAGYYRHVQNCCERAHAAGQAFVHDWALEYEAAQKADARRRSLS